MASGASSIYPVPVDSFPSTKIQHGRVSNETLPLMSSYSAEKFKPEPKQDLKTFVREHFHRKECSRFVKKYVKNDPTNRCRCGEVLIGHVGKAASADLTDSKCLQENLPYDAWDPSSAFKPDVTNAYGEINFINVEHVGGKKPAKYIRMSDEDSVEDLIDLMIDFWKIMEPKAPNLVISVVGGAKNFKLDGELKDTFSTDLIKAVKSTSAWLITSGFNVGVMKAVGQAVREAQSFAWDNDRIVHELKCIGITPWGCVKNRRNLENSDENGEFCANYRTSNVILPYEAMPLNPDHTHYIFVDNGYRNAYQVEDIRAEFEQRISRPKSFGGKDIPVVLVVVEGGPHAIDDVKKSLERSIPVVVCSGTGRAADIPAYAYSHTKSAANGRREIQERHVMKLKEKIFDAYGKNWSNWRMEKIDKRRDELTRSVMDCCQNAQLMIVCDTNKHEDLDLAILTVLLKAFPEADESQRLRQLKLALTWNRVDIAQKEIFREDISWSQATLYEVLEEAILEDKVEFMELILQQGVFMKEFLTDDRMDLFYSCVPKPNQIYTLMYNLFGHEQLGRDNVLRLIGRLQDRFDESSEMDVMKETTDMKGTDVINYPYKKLMIWAVLLHRQKLAKFCWEMGDEPVTSALAASRLYSAIAKNIGSNKSILNEQIMQSKLEFENLATSVLDECHHKDPNKAMLILMRKSPCWNETCLEIAASANDQMFLSSVACQATIDTTWYHGALASIEKVKREVFETASVRGEKKQHVAKFVTSPKSKFIVGTVVYMAFLLLHSYMVLVDFKPDHVTPIEIVCHIWILAFLVDDLHTSFITFPAPTVMSFVSKIYDQYGLVMWLEFLNYLLCFVGFISHLSSSFYMAAKAIYCINASIFCIRIMNAYTASSTLGPKVVMIKRMLKELRMFIMVLIVFLLAYGISSQGLLYHSRSQNWTILKDVLYFPYWELYGGVNLEELDTDSCTEGAMDCRTHHWLVPLLLAAYLLVGNILLLNLLIAIFSNVYDTVEKNSIKIWKYQMYFLVMEYDKKTPFVPPFSIVVHIFLFVKWLVLKKYRGDRTEIQTFGELHLEYLQLFEKEMTANLLRRMKEREKAGLETTVSVLQKRVDEMTKLIEDEVTEGLNQILTHLSSKPEMRKEQKERKESEEKEQKGASHIVLIQTGSEDD